ncbi:NUDIX hydrolase 12, mitochondrial [Tanacetum coccineum]
MVSSPNRDDMVFPKGGWESDETVEEAACREALEEAGVRGVIKVALCSVSLTMEKRDSTEFSRVIKKGKNRREHEVVVETKDNQPVKKEDDDCQLTSTNCHVNGTMTMSTSYGIMLPASIFL